MAFCVQAHAAESAPAPSASDRDYKTVVVGAASASTGSHADPAAFNTRVSTDGADPGRSLPDLLREVPGLSIRDFGVGQRQTLTLRAAEPNQTAVYLDGIPLTAPGRSDVDLSLFDPGLLDAVDVRRSGSSARFGHAALGGVILLQLQKLTYRQHSSASAGYGSWQSMRIRAAHAQSAGAWRIGIGGVFHRSDGDFEFINNNGQPQRRTNNDASGGEALLKVSRLVGNSWRVSMFNSFAMTERGAPGPSMNPSDTARQTDIRNLTALQARRVGLFSETGRLDLSLYHRYDHFRFEEPQITTAGESALDADPSRNNAFAGGIMANLSVPWGNQVTISGGIDLRGDQFNETNTGDRQRLAADLFTSSQVALLVDHVVITPAARVLTATHFDAAIAPKLGVVVRPLLRTKTPSLQGFELLANAGRSYRYPTFQELYLRLDGLYPNADLRPEDAWHVDAGFRWSLPHWLHVELAYFRRWLRNTILYAPTGSFRVTVDNFSAVRATGVEAALAIEPGLCLAAKSAYTYTNTSFSNPARSLPGHPEHQATGRLEWSGARCAATTWHRTKASPDDDTRGWWSFLRGLRVWGEVTAQSSMPLDRNNSETLKEEARALVALGAGYTHRWISVAAHLRNLTDKRDAVDTIGFPIAPRSFFATMKASF